MKKAIVGTLLSLVTAAQASAETVCQYNRDDKPALKYAVGETLEGQVTYKTLEGKVVDLSNCQTLLFNFGTSLSSVRLCGNKEFNIVAVNVGREEMAVTGPNGAIELAFATSQVGSNKKSTLFRWSCEYNLTVPQALKELNTY